MIKRFLLFLSKKTIRPIFDFINGWQDRRFDKIKEKGKNVKQKIS